MLQPKYEIGESVLVTGYITGVWITKDKVEYIIAFEMDGAYMDEKIIRPYTIEKGEQS